MIRFPAQVYKVQTLVDGGIRLTMDLPETSIPEMAMLAECQRNGIALQIEATELQDDTDKTKKTKKRAHY